MSRKFLVPLVLPADPTNALEAATKQYVDGKTATVTGSKLSDLTAQTGAGLATTDLFDTLDISDATMAATGTNKKITLAELIIGLQLIGALPIVRKTTSAINNSSSTVATDVTGMVFPVTAGRTYHISIMGRHQTAATATGIVFVFTAPALTHSHMKQTMRQAVDGVGSFWEAAGPMTTVPTPSASVIAATTDYWFDVEVVFSPSASGNVQFQVRTEVNASQVTVMAGCVGIMTDFG